MKRFFFKHFFFVLFVASVCAVLPVNAFSLAPVNFNAPYDITFRPEPWPRSKGRVQRFRFGTQFEQGSTRKCRNGSGDVASLLSLYAPSESSIAMLQGSASGSTAANLLLQMQNPTDDEIRGRMQGRGRFSGWDVTLTGQYNFNMPGVPGTFDLSVFVPFCMRKFSHVSWTDLTKSNVAADILVKNNLTNKVETLLKDLGDGLDIRDWENSGVGDVVLTFGWHHDFTKTRRHIEKVRLSIRTGYSIGCGAVRDENKALSMPLGNDGASGVPFALGMDVFLDWKLKTGVEFTWLKLFDDTRVRRLKTSRNQTDFFLLNKGPARKKFGTNWKFNVYFGLHHFLRGLSAKVVYQFFRHDEDQLFAKTSAFSNDIINTAQCLQDWTYQAFLFQVSYDCFRDSKFIFFKPQIMLFYKIPVSGRRVIETDTVGGQLTLSF